jgi:long-chain acyl-CoA synthetase
VHAAVSSAVAAVNEKLSRPEQIKSFRIMTSAWTPETGELTPTLKLRRRVIAEQHAATVDDMYPA